ncbi:MAG: SMC-Scp complex subunit ScpB, partial [Phycisphaerae bacterium]|nr:SMC-Scp complex subunit ScpB [Phycisphaerae bacterium]
MTEEQAEKVNDEYRIRRGEPAASNKECRVSDEEQADLPEDDLDSRSQIGVEDKLPGNDRDSDEYGGNEPAPAPRAPGGAEDSELTVESVIEAVLFASDESLTPARLAGIVESGVKQVREHIENLNKKYRAANN